MKRFFIAIAILTAGASVFCALRNSTQRYRSDAAINRDTRLAQTQLILQTRNERSELRARVDALQREWLNRPQVAQDPLAAAVATNSPLHLSPELRQRLLAELGFDWNSMRDYLVVSKDSLRSANLDAIHDNRLTDTVCGVLAMTRDERGAVEAAVARAASDYRQWATSHVERVEPEGNVMAKYTLPNDADFSRSLSNAFCSSVSGSLGTERGNLLLEYARSWMIDLGMDSFGTPASPSTLVVKRDKSGDALNFEFRQAGSTMYSSVSPWQPIPEAFRALFPGGWPDLAAREGFALPKEFGKTQIRR